MKSESEIQREIIKWSRHQAATGKIPELALLYSNLTGAHLANGPVQWGNLVKEGARAGIPDLHLPVARSGYNSIYFEVKTEKGYLSNNQKRVIELLRKHTNNVVIVRSLEGFKTEVKAYLNDE